MASISFPLTLRELTEMRKDRDTVSSFFAYACIGCILLSISFVTIYSLSECKVFKTSTLITIPLSAIFLFVIWYYRPIFLVRKEKQLNRFCEEVEKWIIEKRKEFLTYTSFTVSQIANEFSVDREKMESCIKKLSDRKICHIDNQGNILIGPSAGLTSVTPYSK